MENGPFIEDFPFKKVIFHPYVSLPEGKNGTPQDVGFEAAGLAHDLPHMQLEFVSDILFLLKTPV